jgi:CDP-6-deoxy-D-xylo-4-hexulose-3-dehydrase
MVSAAIVEALKSNGYGNILLRSDAELDLTDEVAVNAFFAAEKPEYVFCWAGAHGGILKNAKYPADIAYNVLKTQLAVFHAAYLHGVKKLLFLVGGCLYPKYAKQPILEDSFMDGKMEPTSAAYSTARAAGVELCFAYNRQYGMTFVPAVLSNYYGIGDDFSDDGHVAANVMHKMHEAKINGEPQLTLWGTGTPRRQFIWSEDLARACILVMKNYDGTEMINIATDQEISIRDLADKLKRVVGYAGDIVFDASRPDGTPRKFLDCTKISALGFVPSVPLDTGLARMYKDYLGRKCTKAPRKDTDMIYPLMDDNILREDLDAVIDFLRGNPRLTQSEKVREFEAAWSKWVGVKHSLFVNSGASANLAAVTALKLLCGEGGEIILPPLTWISDISSVLWNGFTPVFADIDPRTLGMSDKNIIDKLTDKTRAVFPTYVLGLNCLTDRLLAELEKRNIPLIEDVCESHGARFKNRKLGSFGLASNFSFYYAHHMSTIEGGMICTNDDAFYDIARMLRSHGMVREAYLDGTKRRYKEDFPALHPEFTFAFPAFNIRSTEINAVIGLKQLPRLDAAIEKRNENFSLFLNNLDSRKYRVDYEREGMSNYAFILVLQHPDAALFAKVGAALTEAGVEFRRGTAGGGNMLRQPLLQRIVGENAHLDYPETEYIHRFGMYIGNYPSLAREKILKLCEILNGLKTAPPPPSFWD